MGGYIILFIVVFGAIWYIGYMIYTLATQKRRYAELDETEYEPPEAFSWKATVLDKNVEMVQGGSLRVPEHQLVYTVLFQTEEGEKTYEVSKEIIETLAVGQRGTLIADDTEFFSFQ